MSKILIKETGQIFNNRKEAKQVMGRHKYDRFLKERRLEFLVDEKRTDNTNKYE